jgi:hypothetical protein
MDAMQENKDQFETYLNWMMWLIFFYFGAILFFTGIEVLLKGKAFGLISIVVGGAISAFLLKEALEYKKIGGFKKLKPKNIGIYTSIIVAVIISFILISSEIVYPLVKKEEHPGVKNKSYLIESQSKTIYVFDALLFHGFFADTTHELNKALNK